MDGEHLHLLWTNADPITFDKMVMMYAVNSLVHGWWKRVTVILWGATVALTAQNPAIAEKIRLAREAGVEFSACISCARELGVEDKLAALDLEMIPWGPPLTALLKEKAPLLTI